MLLTKSLLRTTDAHIKKLHASEIETTLDLWGHFPRALENRSEVLDTFAYVNLQEKNTIRVTIESITSERTRSGKTLTKVILLDRNNSRAEAVYFTKPYFLSKFAVDDIILVYGKVKYEYGKLSFPSPEFSHINAEHSEFVPVYSDCNYIPWAWFAGKLELIRHTLASIPEVLPANVRDAKWFRPRVLNIEALHFPKSEADWQRARSELAYEELFMIQYRGIERKRAEASASEGKTPVIPLDTEYMKSLIEGLPYTLTNKQKIVLFQILRDMERAHAMRRLLQGDVGTGKTIVAFLAAIHAIRVSGVQVAIMAPTEILARQHFAGFAEQFGALWLRVDLLVGSLTSKQKIAAKARLRAYETDIIIGTHALIEDTVQFANLGFVVVDEQHRFGVNQRKALEDYFSLSGWVFPHTLNMTATPIPRTLALTLYGDQDLSILNEYPAGRLPVHTAVVREDQREQIYRVIEEELRNGRQAFWISPLVEESESLDIASAVNTAETLAAIFPNRRIGLVHGKLKARDKDSVMQDFFERKIDILSSTSVVEVGVNNPNASIMCIEASECFGLSQLHQFRGRVGRWAHQSYCYLFTTKSYVWDRLRALENTNDGFELSEIDLELRWPGEVYGIRQSGLPEFKIADLRDLELVAEIREDIENLF
jgi:ATP-dependent DNA helicase RecG